MIRQLHYTSCRYGRDGIQGFQVAAATPGIPTRHEDLGLPPAAYIPPPPAARGAPAGPSPAALPVALGFRDFGEVAVLFRSYYVGEDFSGRQGNYVAHLLLADQPDRDLAGVVPAAAWEAPFWVRGRLPDPGGTTLPEVASLADAIRAAAEGAAEVVGPWLDRHPAVFTALLGAVRDGLAGRLRQVVVVADGPDPAAEVAAAVLAVTASLPAHLARRVSFTTFSATPADVDLLVVGTTPDVALGPHAARDRLVLRIGGDPPGSATAYAQLVRGRWQAGSAAVAGLRGIAARIRPPVEPDELDTFAAAVPLVDDDVPAGVDALAGLEFLAARDPDGLRPAVWARVEQSIAAGTMRLDNLARWSRLLESVPGHRPVLDAAYLRQALTRLAADGDSEQLWLPPAEPGSGDTTVAWAIAAVEAEPEPAVALRTLRTLDRQRIDPADADLTTLADLAVIPLALDPDGDVEPLRALSFAGRLGRIVAGQLEDRLDDDLVAVVAEGMSVSAARWLYAEAEPAGRVALAAGLRLAAAAEHDPVDLVVARTGDAADLDRLLPLAWDGPPSAADGLRLLTGLDRAVVTGSTLTTALAERLVLDAAHDRTDPDVDRLAARLDTLGSDLPEAARVNVDAVLLTAWFRDHTVRAPDARERIVKAAAAGCWASPALTGPLARALVHWLFVGDEVVAHATALDEGLKVDCRDLLPAYTERIVQALGAEEPDGIVALLPAVADVSRLHQAAAALLDGACATALARRRRKVLDEVGTRLEQLGSVPTELRPGTASSWTAWWKEYREQRITPATPELRDRIRRFGRGG